jgi:hypothetical protein
VPRGREGRHLPGTEATDGCFAGFVLGSVGLAATTQVRPLNIRLRVRRQVAFGSPREFVNGRCS